MKTHNNTIINKGADDVWRVVADEFNQNDKWMAQVYKTRDMENKEHANLDARICELTPTLDGIRTNEAILEYDKESYRLVFNVKIRNGGKLPVKSNIATVTLTKLGDDRTEVNWGTTPSLKPLGYVMAPVLKAGIQKSFKEVLEELKHYVETGEQHPRKVEAMKQMKK